MKFENQDDHLKVEKSTEDESKLRTDSTTSKQPVVPGPPKAPSLARMSTVVYGGMILIGLPLMHFWQGNLKAAFTIPEAPADRIRILTAGVITAAFLMTSSLALEGWSEPFRRLKDTFRQLVGPSSPLVAVWLALASSFGEEILFRGALQPSLGVIPTSILFGLAHVGPDGRIGAWSFWAAGAGMVMGWTFQETGCLWPAILAHFLVNAISLLALQRQYHQR